MNQNLNFALGFFITVIFFASLVVVLTLVYFSHPRFRKRAVKKETGLQKAETSKEVDQVDQSGPAEDNTALAGESSVPETETSIKPAISETEIPPEVPEFPENTVADPPNSSRETANDSNDNNNKEGLSLNSLHTEEQSLTQPNSQSEKERLQEISPQKENPSTVTLSNTSAESSAPSPLTPSLENKTDLEMESTEPDEGMKPEIHAKPAATSIKIVNENQENKMEEKPKNVKPDADFSELFMDDAEENESARLAKELNDIDTDDILQTSIDLISQLKKNKNSTAGNKSI
jgi:hypothetical protein